MKMNLNKFAAVLTVLTILPFVESNWNYYHQPNHNSYSSAPLRRIEPEMTYANYTGQRSFGSCDQFYENRIDDDQKHYGLLKISDPDIPNSETKITISIAARLSSVS